MGISMLIFLLCCLKIKIMPISGLYLHNVYNMLFSPKYDEIQDERQMYCFKKMKGRHLV